MTTKLNFVVLPRGGSLPPTPRPLFVLQTDNWDDFGYVVQYHLSYRDAKNQETRLGPVKVLQRSSAEGSSFEVEASTTLPKKFNDLGEEFISLGQKDSYYTGLHQLLPDRAAEVLEALRDIAWLPALADNFEPTPAFRNAMMRENGAQRARRFGRAWTTGKNVSEKLAFTYIGMIEGADSDVEAKFEFNPNDRLPGRIVGIIGRNAVGKTRFLASLGADLAQITRSSAESLSAREERFPDGRPLFTRIIAISYSAFDRFKRPQRDSSSS